MNHTNFEAVQNEWCYTFNYQWSQVNTYGVFADVAGVIHDALNDLGLPTVIRTCVDLRMVSVCMCVRVYVRTRAYRRDSASVALQVSAFLL